ncbi:hypothetical protein J31TS4_16930 [Paenibacillus sp. J31TS4]|uniref:polysaccharide deacetylase family protein n=1 Tax=Paenibacillus sp. J31TS4 TaxID=2807195 RepID=UPI001B24B0B5|nr:polysaccharide deacetylase family protein [Paenibacillus sp. J31TS4]GIP38413.1 hypothetical protein J31TS4_16930 [Paenibacillus sp. J31TS4]
MPGAYQLDIVGESERLEVAARQRMEDWRRQAVRFTAAYPGAVYTNGPDAAKVALTFDDGPDSAVTHHIAEILTQYGLKGSFFFVGSQVTRFPEIVQAVHEGGHLVGNHSYRHPRLTELAPEAVQSELEETQEAIQAAIGRTPALFRPPFGSANPTVIEAARRLGCATVLWSLDTLDWLQKEEAHIRLNVDRHVRGGEIILMHSSAGCTETAKAMPRLVESLLKRGLAVAGLDELLGIAAYRESAG